MIVLFDSNSYDKLIELSQEDLQQIYTKIEKVIIPQAVRRQLDMMVNIEDKMEKLYRINQIIFHLDNQNKLIKVEDNFELELYDNEKKNYFRSLSNKMKNGDKEIAFTAKQENATMITNDSNFVDSLSNINQKVLSFEDFINKIADE